MQQLYYRLISFIKHVFVCCNLTRSYEKCYVTIAACLNDCLHMYP